jgi:hypothetical protein
MTQRANFLLILCEDRTPRLSLVRTITYFFAFVKPRDGGKQYQSFQAFVEQSSNNLELLSQG